MKVWQIFLFRKTAEMLLIFTCGDKCEHTHDNACDETCNKVEEAIRAADEDAYRVVDGCNTAVAWATDHNDTDHDFICDNLGCQISLDSALKDYRTSNRTQ